MKKIFLFLFFAGLCGGCVNAQDITELKDTIVENKDATKEEKQTVFIDIEQQPEFPGGFKELMKYLNDNLKYPKDALGQGIEGRVRVQFIVTKTGEISNVKILQSLHPSCDEEAVRLISSMPKWIPGKQNGVPVNVYYTVPIRFTLEKKNKIQNSDSKSPQHSRIYGRQRPSR